MLEINEPTIQTKKLDEGAIVAERYKILRHVADGGMASVYEAEDIKKLLPGTLAIKILHSSLSEDETYVERFLQEAKAISNIHHPSVIELLDIGSSHGQAYLCMPFIEAPTLEQLIHENNLEDIYLKTLIRSICEGLQAIHESGIIHRDLKPANLLVLENSKVKITDFGIAKLKESKLTSTHQKVGSLPYIPPEAWMGEEPSPSFDFYSLGVTLYELLTGYNPFYSELPAKVMKLHLGPVPPAPSSLNTEIPPWADKLTLWLLQKKPRQRPSSAGKIIEFLKSSGERDQKHPTLLHHQRPGSIQPVKSKTYVLSLSAEALKVASVESENQAVRNPRSKTVTIKLPRNAAFQFNFTPPSRDVVAAGIFLASLQGLDGYLTSIGVTHFGVEKEGNSILRTMMHLIGPEYTLILAKVFAIIAVILLTLVAKKHREFKPVINILSAVYLAMAIIPWVIILLKEQQLSLPF